MINGSINFVISDNILDFNSIEQELNIRPTKCIRKGQKILQSRDAPFDVWIYQVKFEDEISFASSLENLLGELVANEDAILSFKKRYSQICIDFYIRSDMGQFGFSLNSQIIKTLSSLELDTNYHILSYGFAE